MDVKQIHQLTNERIAVVRDNAVRDLVRSNAMLVDEVQNLRAIVLGQDPVQPCRGCVRWHSVSRFAAHCDDPSTPEPWCTSASEGGEPGCPNYTVRSTNKPIKATIERVLLQFEEQTRDIHECMINGYIRDEQAYLQKERLAGTFADRIITLIEEEGHLE